MSDEWGRDLFVASYGGIELDVVSFRDSMPRRTAQYEYQHRDGGHVDDQGAGIRSTSLQLTFEAGLRPDHISNLAAFVELLHDGEAHEFVHPISGAYIARPEAIDWSADATLRDVIPMSVTFLEHEPDPAAFEVGQGAPALAGIGEVSAARDGLNAELAAQGLSSDAGADAVAAVEGWESGDIARTQREINLELNAVANLIDSEIDRLELATDIDRQPALQGMLRLREASRRAADKVIASGPKLIRYEVRATMPLLAVVQELYGGRGAETRFRQLLDLNDIGDPSRIARGTVLTAQSPDSRLALGAR